jgi:transcriptional regulator with XRE-family HTH domain
MLLPSQLRAARALLGWNRDRLASAAGVHTTSVERAEGSRGAPPSDEIMRAIRSALEDEGVIFIGGKSPGVRLRPSEPDEPDEEDNTPNGFIVYAECYGRAAFRVANAGHLPHNAPVATLALHCMELALKAVLLAGGVSGRSLQQRYGHDLKRLFRDSGLDWSDIDQEHIDFYADALESQTLRYRRSSRAYLIEKDHILPITEKVFHRCLSVILPGAKRTLRA